MTGGKCISTIPSIWRDNLDETLSHLDCRAQVLKPRGSPEISITLKPLLCEGSRGSIDETVSRRGIVDSAGVLERCKGMGWIAWEPERSRSRPRESKPAIGSPVEHRPWSGRHPPAFRERELRDTNRGG
jgi:hypothetical protein